MQIGLTRFCSIHSHRTASSTHITSGPHRYGTTQRGYPQHVRSECDRGQPAVDRERRNSGTRPDIHPSRAGRHEDLERAAFQLHPTVVGRYVRSGDLHHAALAVEWRSFEKYRRHQGGHPDGGSSHIHRTGTRLRSNFPGRGGALVHLQNYATDDLRQEVALQPGKYRVLYRAGVEHRTVFSQDRSFSIVSHRPERIASDQ